MNKKYVLSLVLLGLCSCARAPLKKPDQALRPTAYPQQLNDDLEFASLIKALESTVERWRERSDETVAFGPRSIPRKQYLESLEFLLAEAKADSTGERFRGALKSRFESLEVYGDKKWGEVMVTSYFEPVIEGSSQREGRFTQPLFAVPKNFVEIDIGSFERVRPQLSVLRDTKLEQRSKQNLLRGRLVPGPVPRVVAMPDRREIDGGAIQEHAKPLAWVDPIDGFILEIQGSGVVKLKSGEELKVGYAGQNGHAYVAIGKFLLDKIPRDKMSIQAIEAHLRSLPDDQARQLMHLNPSFVFFRKLESAGQTYFGTEVIAGRTIATDQGLFPKGTLAFLEFERPVFGDDKASEPSAWYTTSRFVVDHDTGGAIRGPHRVDLFWGRGPEAKRSAGFMKNRGRLVYFVPKPEAFAAPQASSR